MGSAALLTKLRQIVLVLGAVVVTLVAGGASLRGF